MSFAPDELWPLKCDFKRGMSVTGRFQGLGSTFGNVDLGGDIVEHGAFAKSLEAVQPMMFWQHDDRHPIGVWESAEETKDGLALDGQLLMDTERGHDAFVTMKAGAINGLSIGFRVDGPDGAVLDEHDRNIRRLKSVELLEVSIVSFPMNPKARISAIKARRRLERGEQISKRELDVILRDAGFTDRQAKAITAEGHTGLFQRDAEVSDEEALLNAIRYCSQRIVGNGH